MTMKKSSETLNKINPNSLQFSEKAINHFKSQLLGKSDASFVRIGVREAGCSGYEYFLNLKIFCVLKILNLHSIIVGLLLMKQALIS